MIQRIDEVRIRLVTSAGRTWHTHLALAAGQGFRSDINAELEFLIELFVWDGSGGDIGFGSKWLSDWFLLASEHTNILDRCGSAEVSSAFCTYCGLYSWIDSTYLRCC